MLNKKKLENKKKLKIGSQLACHLLQTQESVSGPATENPSKANVNCRQLPMAKTG